jgi:hypothetical protein
MNMHTAIDGRAEKVSAESVPWEGGEDISVRPSTEGPRRYHIPLLLCFTWNELLIASWISGFTFDVIKKKAMRNWFLQKKLTIVYIYYWKVWSIVLYSLKQNHECAIINYLCTVCLLSSTENSKYTLSWY